MTLRTAAVPLEGGTFHEVHAWRSRRPVGTLAAVAVWTVLALAFVFPLAILATRAGGASADDLRSIFGSPRLLAAFRTTFLTSIAAATADVALALPVAWVLARYDFRGRRVIDALVDLPLALPTSVAGLTLAAITSERGPLGALLAAWGLRVAYAPLGLVVALAFVGLPYVVRAIEPVVQVLDEGVLEAAASLGASRFDRATRIVLPALLPAVLSGFGAALARSLGEYGSVVFVGGNLPFKTEVVSLFIVARLEEHEPVAAAVIAVLLVASSMALLALVSVAERRIARTLVPAERV